MRVRRVVVAISPGDRSRRVIREAARVASRFDAELDGVFVEDEDLLTLAAHAFSRAIDTEGMVENLDARAVESEWRALAAEVRATLEREAAARRLKSRFEVHRARSQEAMRAAVEVGDVVVIGWGGWSPRARQTAPVRVLLDGTDAGERAVQAGLRLAGPKGQLAVWVIGADEARVDEVRAELTGQTRRLRVAPIQDPSVAAVRHILAARPGGLLVVPASTAIAQALAERDPSARFAAGVLVVH